MNRYLLQFQEILLQGILTSSIEEATENVPSSHLCIHLKPDQKGRKRELILVVHEQILGMPQEKSSLRISVEYTFPFALKDSALLEMSSVLHFLNRYGDFPGFFLDEGKGEAGFRTVWFSTEQGATPPIIQGVVGLILLLIDSLEDLLEAIATGEKDFQNFLQELIEPKH